MAGRAPTDLNLMHYLKPRYIHIWIFLAFTWAFSRLPYAATVWLGKKLGSLLYYIIPSKRRIAEINIRLAFPDKSPEEQSQLVKANFQQFGLSVMEMPLTWWGSKKDFQRLKFKFEGTQYIDAALADPRGILLLGNHMYGMELGGRLLATKYDISVSYQMIRDELLDVVVYKKRCEAFERVIERMDMRNLVKIIKQGKVMWYGPDQDFGRHRSVFVPFFGIQTATLTATAKIARMTDAIVIPFFVLRMPDNSYVLKFHPPLENYPCGDDEKDAALVNQVIEQEARIYPEQYVWIHRRFKTRPAGEKKIY